MSKPLHIGDRVKLSGGYGFEPAWLQGQTSYIGTVCNFIPGQNELPAVVVQLDQSITVDGVTGDIVVLELRYSGASWQATETVHVELYCFMPDSAPWQARRQGKWVESHATYERIA